MQLQRRFWQQRFRRQHLLPAQILGTKDQLPIVAGTDKGISETIDRRVEHRAAKLVAVGGRSLPPPAKPSRSGARARVVMEFVIGKPENLPQDARCRSKLPSRSGNRYIGGVRTSRITRELWTPKPRLRARRAVETKLLENGDTVIPMA